MISPASPSVKFTKKEIKALFLSARRVLRQPGLDFLLAPTTNLKGQLVVVTSRLVGNAPERNKVRRRLKAIFHEEKFFQKLFDCIVIVKKGGVELPFTDLKDALLKAYAKAQKMETHVQKPTI